MELLGDCVVVRGQIIGEGASTVVVAGMSQRNNAPVAVKIVPLKNKKCKKAFINEKNTYSTIQESLAKKKNLYLCQIEEISVRGNEGIIIMKQYKQDLFNFITQSSSYMKEAKAKRIFKRICKGVSDLHSVGIAHLDIKPENILLDGKNNPRVCDFGTSVEREQLVGLYGSANYHAPEMLKDTPYDPFKCDVYSLAMLLFVMLSGTLPQKGEDGRLNCSKLEDRGVSSQCIDLLTSMSEPNPKFRPSLRSALTHKWLQGRRNALQKLQHLRVAQLAALLS